MVELTTDPGPYTYLGRKADCRPVGFDDTVRERLGSDTMRRLDPTPLPVAPYGAVVIDAR